MQFDWSASWQTVQRIGADFLPTVPRLLMAGVIVRVFVVIAKITCALIRRNAMCCGEPRTLELAIGGLRPANLMRTLGIGGVAIGFTPLSRTASCIGTP